MLIMAHESGISEGAPTGLALRILIVEDHADTARIMELLLQRHGYEVGVAASVAEAMMLAKDRQYDMLISDVRLPDGNGFDLLKDLRSSQNLKGICISGGSSDEDKRRGELAGFDEYLTKPVQVAELLEVIRRLQKNTK